VVAEDLQQLITLADYIWRQSPFVNDPGTAKLRSGFWRKHAVGENMRDDRGIERSRNVPLVGPASRFSPADDFCLRDGACPSCLASLV
jgi:hypothetical protein